MRYVHEWGWVWLDVTRKEERTAVRVRWVVSLLDREQEMKRSTWHELNKTKQVRHAAICAPRVRCLLIQFCDVFPDNVLNSARHVSHVHPTTMPTTFSTFLYFKNLQFTHLRAKHSPCSLVLRSATPPASFQQPFVFRKSHQRIPISPRVSFCFLFLLISRAQLPFRAPSTVSACPNRSHSRILHPPLPSKSISM